MARGHRISPDLPNNEKLIRFSKNKLRYELVLRRPKLEELELDYAGAWNIKTPNILLRSFLKKLDLADQFRLTGEKYRFLKPRLQVVFEAWKSGTDLKAVLAKNTFYRYRREILKHGVDIGIPRNNPDKDLIPIRNILDQEFIRVPKWAIESGLLYLPKID
ncbi:II/X family phage/plasmid replication protein [Nitrospina gracilis Nb-211]|nr:II/X family phage/plasmid replication protein [Nitrospina gracilis Nb-211]